MTQYEKAVDTINQMDKHDIKEFAKWFYDEEEYEKIIKCINLKDGYRSAILEDLRNDAKMDGEDSEEMKEVADKADRIWVTNNIPF